MGQTITHSNFQTLIQVLNKLKVESLNTMIDLEWQTQTYWQTFNNNFLTKNSPNSGLKVSSLKHDLRQNVLIGI